MSNPLDFLYKISSQQKIPIPQLYSIREEGPSHNRNYIWEINFMNISCQGQGKSKKIAKRSAASNLLSELKNSQFIFSDKKIHTVHSSTLQIPYSTNDHYIILKYKSIYPSRTLLTNIIQELEIIETTLRINYNESITKESLNIVKVGDTSFISLRDLSFTFLILSDSSPICSNVNYIYSCISETNFRIKEIQKDLDNEVGFILTSHKTKLVVRVLFSCVSSSYVNCALLENERINWLTKETDEKLLVHSKVIFGILKELAERHPIWNPVTDWSIIVLVKNSLSSGLSHLSPSSSLLRVFEVIGSGLLCNGGPGLKDPLEKGLVDIFGNLTSQQIEDITFSAQHFIRLISFRQIHKVLAMEKLPSKRKKIERIHIG